MEQRSKHWSDLKEKGCLLGLKFMLKSYQFFGGLVAHLFLIPVITYFYCASSQARAASKKYLAKINPAQSSFMHFLSFGQAALDKLSVWNNDICYEDIEFSNHQALSELVASKKGAVLLTAHLGNIEIARALSSFEANIKINAIVFQEHAQNFNRILSEVNPKVQLNIIHVSSFDINLAMTLQDKIASGEFIVIMADRTSPTHPERTTQANFLGSPAAFPQGPFILAGLLACPVYLMLCLKVRKKRFRLVFEEFAEQIQFARPQRTQQLTEYTQKYADRLALFCKQYPLQWFNFFDFWQTGAQCPVKKTPKT